jgi:hypothetical protein
MTKASSNTRERSLTALGFATILLGVYVGWARAHGHLDDFSVLQLMGTGILKGENVYSFGTATAVREGIAGMVAYPPATGFVMAPFGLFSYAAGKVAWFLTMYAAVIIGVRSLFRLAAPTLGRHVWMLTAGGILLSASIRWGVMILQGAPLVLGLLCLFISALHSGRPRLTFALAAVATAFKMTLSLPFLGLLLLHRRFVALGSALLAWVALNGLGFLRYGQGALASFRENTAAFDSIALPHNINSPDPWQVFSSPRLDWVYLFYGASGNLPISKLLSLVCAGLVAAWLFWEGLRTRENPPLAVTTLFAAALVCLGSLCVYHHHYDACLLFAPLILIALGSDSVRKPSWALLLTLPLALMITIMPIGVLQSVIEASLGQHWIGLLKLSFPVCFTLSLWGLLVILRRYSARPEEATASIEIVARPPAA